MSRLLITGAAGNMGRLLRPLLRRDDRVLRLTDLTEQGATEHRNHRPEGARWIAAR